MLLKKILKRARKKADWKSQADLAKRLGVHYMTVQKWELGKALPSDENIKPLSKALDIEEIDLIKIIYPKLFKKIKTYLKGGKNV